MYHHLMTVLAMLVGVVVHAQHTGNAPYCHERGGLIINEVSNGPKGFGIVQEYIELVVVGNPTNPTAPVNIQGWILDDNNYPSSGQGNQQGHLVFGDCYAAVPVGAILVIYNSRDPSNSLPPEDPMDEDGDGIYIIPHEHPCLDACISNPSIEDGSYCPCPNQNSQLEGWLFGLRNDGDVAQIRDACETLVHALHWNGVKLVAEIENTPVHHSIGNTKQSNKLFHFANLTSNDWNDPTNYENVEVDGNETPGAPNSLANALFINQLKEGRTPCNGLIWDCRDTDAGDLIVPVDALSENAPIELCAGDDLSAFQNSYEAADEFRPDAAGFDYEYAFLLTFADAPIYTILETSRDGDFDFSPLDTGTYFVWGYSYIQTNGSISLDSFLNTANGESITTIRDYIACGYHGDLAYNDPIGIPMEIKIIQEEIPLQPTISPVVCEGTKEFDLTQLDTLVSTNNKAITWYADEEGTTRIADPSHFDLELLEVFAQANRTCFNNRVVVNFDRIPTPDFTLEIMEEVTCEDSLSGAVQVFWESPSTPTTIIWNDTNLNGRLRGSALSSGNYDIQITDEFGCSAMDSVNLFPPVCIITTPTIQDSISQDSILSSIPVDTTSTIPDSANIETPPIFLEEPIIEEMSYFVPTVFSPNFDGVNDQFTLFTNDKVQTIKSLRIFDRWGNLVFEQLDFSPNQMNKGWDGTYQGQLMDSAVFIFYAELEVERGILELVKGDFVLLK